MRCLTVVLAACPLLAACSFDAVGNSITSALESSTTDASTTDASTTTVPTPTTGEPDPETTTTTTTTAGPTTTPPEPTTSTTEPVDPSTSSSGSDESSSSGPPPPSCGDGVVDMAAGEDCDDGNTDDTDACTNACKAAKCGDGIVQAGVDMCDDGNADEDDACTSTCAPPTCNDMAKNGGETDLDCGGPCDGCDAGEACVVADDCKFANCDGNKCHDPPHCMALKSKAAPSGTYTIDPDQAGPGVPFQVWCEQDFGGGGWTLALKADGNKQNFAYTNMRWTDDTTLTPDPDLSRDETKLASFSTLAVAEVLVGVESPILADGALTLNYIQLNAAAPSLMALFAGMPVVTSKPENEWRALVTTPSLQNGCRRQGFNAQSTGNDPQNYARVRIGIIANDQGNCDSPNSWIGVGGSGTGNNCQVNYTSTVGNRAACGSDMGDKDTKAFAVVFVR